MNCFKRLVLSGLLLGGTEQSCAAVIKFATLAPEGSAWMSVMRAFAKEVADKTGGDVQFKIYPGGVQGDEKDVIRKIRLGQLHSGGFTGVGIGEIAPQLRVLDAPFLFKSDKEIDCVYSAFDREFRAALEAKGYVLLGWTEVGFVYLFTNSAAASMPELKSVKLWMWEGDPIAQAAFTAMGISPVPLSITDVMTSLQTGLINGVYGSPLSVVALQWFTRVKYMLSLPIANASGAVLMAKKEFDKLNPEQRSILLEAGKKHFAELTRVSRQDNAKSIATLEKEGIKIITPAAAATAAFEAAGAAARKSLAGRLYPAELLARVEAKLQEFRKSKANP